MSTLLLINTQTRRVQRIHDRVIGEAYEYDPRGDTLLDDLESLRVHGDVSLPLDGEFNSAPLAAMTANILLSTKQ